MSEIDRISWIKSTFSNGSGGNNCVEVAFLGETVVVRDSKNPTGLPLVFSLAEWTAFLAGANAGEFDLNGP